MGSPPYVSEEPSPEGGVPEGEMEMKRESAEGELSEMLQRDVEMEELEDASMGDVSGGGGGEMVQLQDIVSSVMIVESVRNETRVKMEDLDDSFSQSADVSSNSLGPYQHEFDMAVAGLTDTSFGSLNSIKSDPGPSVYTPPPPPPQQPPSPIKHAEQPPAGSLQPEEPDFYQKLEEPAPVIIPKLEESPANPEPEEHTRQAISSSVTRSTPVVELPVVEPPSISPLGPPPSDFPLDLNMAMDVAEVETELPTVSHTALEEIDTLGIPSLSTQSSLVAPSASSQPLEPDNVSLSSSIWTLDTEGQGKKAEPVEERNATPLTASVWGAYLTERVKRFSGRPWTVDLAVDHRFGEASAAAESGKKGWLSSGVKVLFGRGEEMASLNSDELGEGEFVDVVSDSALPESVAADEKEGAGEEREKLCPYDYRKAKRAMLQMEQHLTRSRPDAENAHGGKGKGGARMMDMEDPLAKTYQRRSSWTARQKVFFDACIRILYQERHVRLAYASDPEEAILRRLSLDKCSGRFRRLMAGTQWNGRMVYWLHSVIIENLPPPMLAIYFEILQTLRPKIAELVNSLLNYMLPMSTDVGGGTEKLMKLLEEPWDPVGSRIFSFSPMVKFAKEVVFIMAPHPYSYSKAKGGLEEKEADCARSRVFLRFFSQFGLLVQVAPDAHPRTCTPNDLYKNWMTNTKTTILEMARLHSDKALILVGMGVGALLACQATLLEGCQSLCTAIICLGFPIKTPRGIHGRYGSPLLKLQTAVQFVIGLAGRNCPLEEFVEFRSKLEVDSEVVLATGCDDYLRMKHYVKSRLRITQSMADRCLLEECVHFIYRIIPKAERLRQVAKARAELPVVEVSPKKRKKPATSRPAAKRVKPNVHADTPTKNSHKVETPSLSTESPSGGSSASQSQDSTSGIPTPWPAATPPPNPTPPPPRGPTAAPAKPPRPALHQHPQRGLLRRLRQPAQFGF
ncbi:uncharacterized protein LOC129597776 isoform X2 [Paramacrobiotus metropolitanus]|uniref:uncharacterized protein LOC129597776 isoform X2 n=1 Tax=Paramacrobiotus metropolitanus TaxID=2943436 RepID=UPI002445BF9C|nr:uncharacterized protein LOC129597776 isoform X2 [Paramacrobiotus metropolitanus]